MSPQLIDDVEVVVVDDQRTIREGLALLIGDTPGYRCSGVFADIESALPTVENRPPDVMLIDLGPPGMARTDGIRALCRRYPELSVIVLTVYDDDERVFGALCAGAHGSLSKKTPPEGLIAAVRSVVHGGGIVSPDAARRILALLSSPTGDAPAEWTLDAADSTVLRMLAQGHNLETAADELRTPVARLAAGTRRIYDKLHRFCRLAASPP